MRLKIISCVALLVSIILVLPSLNFTVTVTAQQEYPANPEIVNKLLNTFQPLNIAPGNTGRLTFNMTNNYLGTMSNMRLTIEIYKYITTDEERLVNSSSFYHAPLLRTVDAGDLPMQNIIISDLPSYRLSYYNHTISLPVITDKATPKGTYIVRFTLKFTLSTVKKPGFDQWIMKSRSYFTNEEWKAAELGASDYDKKYTGGINLTMLGVDGILPDTAFSVTEPPNMVGFYILIGLATFFGFLGYGFYMYENYGKYPWLEEWWQSWKYKIRTLKRIIYRRTKLKK